MAGYFRAKQPMAASEIMSKVIVQKDATCKSQCNINFAKICKDAMQQKKPVWQKKGEQMELTSPLYKRGKELLYVTLMQG